MADRFYSCKFGADKVAVAETATATSTADVELRITFDAVNNNKQAALIAIDNLRSRIIEDTWPPV